MAILPKKHNAKFFSMSFRSFAVYKKKTPFTWHQVKAWSEAKGEGFLEGKGRAA
jgi:hypothetical protein